MCWVHEGRISLSAQICSFTLKYLLRSCRVHFLNCLQLRTLFIFNCFQFARTALQSHCQHGSVGTRSTNVCTLTSNIQPDVMLHLHDGVFLCVCDWSISHTQSHTLAYMYILAYPQRKYKCAH